MIVGVDGLGAVGVRVVRELVGSAEVLVRSSTPVRTSSVVESFDGSVSPWVDARPVDVVVLSSAPGRHVDAARRALASGSSVVSTSGDRAEIEELLELGPQFEEAGRRLVAGAGATPGLTLLLARHAAELLERVDEIHVASVGAAGPACARSRQESAASDGREWRDGAWETAPGGSGRELVWFPDPVGAKDCSRGDLVETQLLVSAFPGVTRVSARISATGIPVWRWGPLAIGPVKLGPVTLGRSRSVLAGAPGALRVEVRGFRNGEPDAVVYAAMDHLQHTAGGVAAVTALGIDSFAAGGSTLADAPDPLAMLNELRRRGIKAATYDVSR